MKPPEPLAAVSRKLLHGASWNLVGAVGSRALQLLALVIVARLVSVVEFGVLGMLQTTVVTFEVLAGAGLGLTATKYVAEYAASDPARAGRIVSLALFAASTTGVLMAVALGVLAPVMEEQLLGQPASGLPFLVVALAILIGAISTVQTAILAGMQCFQTNAKINLAYGVMLLALVPLGAYVAAACGAIGGMGVARGGAALLNGQAIRRDARRRGLDVAHSVRAAMPEWRCVLNYSVPALLTNGLAAVVAWVTSVMLMRQPGGGAQMAIVNVANQWKNILLFLPNVVLQAAAPLFAQLQLSDGGDQATARTLYRKIWLLNSAAVGCLALGCLLLSVPILALYGEEYAGGRAAFCVFIVAVALQASQAPAIMVMQARGFIWSNLALNIAWAVLLLATAAALVERGALGLAVANLVGFAVFGLLLRRALAAAMRSPDC